MFKVHYFPFDILNLIFEYDGRIKYSHKERIYRNIISKNDPRYSIIKTKINNKKELINKFNKGNNGLKYYIDIFYKNQELGMIFCKKML